MMRWSMALSPHQYSRLRARPWVHGWLLFCLMFGLITPGLSHAIVNLSVQDEHKIAVCTASGMTYIRWQNTETLPIAQTSHQSHQCLICSFGGDTPLGWQQREGISHQIPGLLAHNTVVSVNRSPCYWVTAAIRAPPAFFS